MVAAVVAVASATWMYLGERFVKQGMMIWQDGTQEMKKVETKAANEMKKMGGVFMMPTTWLLGFAEQGQIPRECSLSLSQEV